MVHVQQVADALAKAHAATGAWPELTALAAEQRGVPARDLWDRPFVVDVRDGAVVVRSAGVDRRLHTDDDLVSEPGRPEAPPAVPDATRLVCPPRVP